MPYPYVALVGVDTQITGTGGGGTGEIPVPAGVLAGDVLMLVVATLNGGSMAVGVPAALSPIKSVAANAFQSGCYLYGRVSTGSEPATYTVTQNGGGVARAQFIVIRGAASSFAAAINAAEASGAQGGVTTIAAPALTTTVASTLYLLFAFEWNQRTRTLSPGSGSGLTMRVAYSIAGISMGVADAGVAAAGAVTGKTLTSNDVGDFYSLAVAIAPGASGPTADFSITTDAAVFSGSAAPGSSTSASMAVATADAVFSGSASVVPGTLTTPPISNNVPTVLANISGWIVDVYLKSTGAFVLRKTGLSTDSVGVISFTDAALTPGVAYCYDVIHPVLGRRMPEATAT